MKLKRNQRGFSLVETLIAIGISTGTALIIYKVLGESQRGQLVIENRDDMVSIHREIVGKFTDRAACTATISNGLKGGATTFPIKEILRSEKESLLQLPVTYGKITVNSLTLQSISEATNQAEIEAVYSYVLAAKPVTLKKNFRLEVSFKDGQFDSCVSRGNLGLDPKDACDLVVGQSTTEKSYYYNGICNFARAACEQSGRVWSEDQKKCRFSEDDLEELRNQICETMGFDYSKEKSMCLPRQVHLDAIEALRKATEGKQ